MQLAIFLLIVVILAVASALSLRNRFRSIGKPDNLFSNILKEKRRLWICMPPTPDEPDPDRTYPVVYLLDAETQFASFTQMIQEVNEDGTRIFPEMIVIGIPNTSRSRDLTPTRFPYNAEGYKASEFKPSGGGENFIAFLEKELIPYIGGKYPVSDQRILIGHSLGGLAAINILLYHTTLFNSYVASDPSLWWDNQLILKQAQDILPQQKFDGRKLYIGIANTMPAGMDITQARTADIPKTNHIRSVLQFTDLLESNTGNGLSFSYKYYEKHDHNAVPLVVSRDALQFLFSLDNLPEVL